MTKNAGDCCPAWSPDGQTIAFSRFEDKEFQIYTIPVRHDAGGGVTAGTEKKLNTGGITPRRGQVAWSPDGKTLAFAGGARIILLNLGDGTVYRLTESPPLSEDWGPSFSPDGRRVLLVRSRDTGFSVEILTIPVYGGSVARVASEPARILGPPQWSFDGQSVIFASDRNYAKTAYANPEIWQVPVDGGTEHLVSPMLRPSTWASWSVTDAGIVFAAPSGTGKPVVSLYDFVKRKTSTLGELETVPFWLAAPKDAKVVVFDQPGWEQAQIMLVENFR